MKKQVLILIFALLLSGILVGQEGSSISESRKSNLINLLNYRYKGGFFDFEKLFNLKVTYPEMAKGNCIMGIILIDLTVDCNGTITDVRTKNNLGYGIDQMVSNFIVESEGQWNKCNDDKYTRMEIPVQFKIEGTQTAENEALLVCIGQNPGLNCKDDDDYLKKAEAAIEKGKKKRALENLDKLIKRNPYNPTYYEMKQKAINLK
ncbi:MAG: energy transducer TonB [Bacteroidales bacterium]|jgi:hypothetical protein|nr:energy transducer TonB [Bacteroidales bacterium]